MRKRLFSAFMAVAVIISAVVLARTFYTPSAGPEPAETVVYNTEDAPLKVSFADGDLAADQAAFVKVVQAEWPRGTRLPQAAQNGNLADLNKACQVKWLSGNLISLDLGGVRHEIWVSVPPAPSQPGGAVQGPGQEGRPIQTLPDWWKKGFFIPAPTDAPYLLASSDLTCVPVIPPEAIRYQPIKIPQAVVAWLSARDSAEAGTAYLDMLDQAGKKYDVNPLLLLAITGQEQSFVPKFLDDWEQVIKNPFNVYYSWQEYAPGFLPAAMVAAKTVNHLSGSCPAGMNPIEWIDSPANPDDRYAGDTTWWKGVSVFFSILQRVGGE